MIKLEKVNSIKKSFKGVLVGYEQNGYKVLDTETGKFIKARDVIFDEVNFKNSRPSVQIEENERTNSHVKRVKIDINTEINNNLDKTDKGVEISESK